MGFLLIVAAFLVWSHFSWGGSPKTYSCYFEESIQGLTLNSPVRFRGITIGQVTHIGIAPDGRLAEIFFSVDPHSHFSVDTDEMFIRIVGNLLTGIKYLEIEMIGNRDKPSRDFPFEPYYPAVGTYHSMSAEDIFYEISNFFKDLNIKTISTSLTNILAGLEYAVRHDTIAPIVSNITYASASIGEVANSVAKTITKERLENFVTNVSVAVQNFRAISEELDRGEISNIVYGVDGVVTDVRKAVAEISPEDVQKFKQSCQTLIDKSNALVSSAQDDLDNLITEVQRAAINIRAFTDSLRSRPAQTLFGERDKETKE